MSTVLVTGASQGLGLEMVRQYANSGWDVIASCRTPDKATELQVLKRKWGGAVNVETLDVTRPEQIEWLAGKYANTAIDLLINNAGDIGPRGAAKEQLHKQFFGSLDYAAWQRVIDINTFGPMRIAEAFVEHVERSAKKKMIFMSSTTGSNIEGLHDIFAYCSSKAALNKCVTMLSRAVRDRGIIATALCPGHVRTALGGAGATIDAQESVTGLRKIIAGLTMADSGGFIRYNGERVAW
jgi:NAD(P)-dependent dehydrogenase (short-subunit alcohol dehydrogenase family)